MKKIISFFIAIILIVSTIFGIHMYAIENIKSNSDEFGRWISTKKDLSYKAISSNIDSNTFLMLGSSEFHHGKNKAYHPSQIFRETNMDVMCIGAAKNQSLSHAITLAAIAPKLETKKVLILLSPSWFSKNGIDKAGFTARFSESNYLAMLDNKCLSDDLINRISTRTQEVLDDNMSVYDRIKSIGATNNKTVSLKAQILNKIHKVVLSERELVSVGLTWAKHNHLTKNFEASSSGVVPDWKALEKKYEAEFLKEADNEFYIRNNLYVKEVFPMIKERKDADANRTYGKSPEYKDLELLLDVCKESGIEAHLLLLPVNGYWYDYTGFPKENREIIVEKINDISVKYNVQFTSLFDECYTPGFLEDIVHPAGKGWIRINEKAYEFFKKS